MYLKLISLCLIVLCCCSSGSDELNVPAEIDSKKSIDGNPDDGTWRILFVGNSLTYTNDLPQLIKEIAAYDSIGLNYSAHLLPGYSLEDHWNDGKVQADIKKSNYDFIVAQQGPSALPESQVLLLDYASRFASLAADYQSKFALYMVWPSADRSFDHDNVIYSYTNASQKLNAILCPAGKAWKLAWSYDASLPLYSPDQFHPSLMGSVLAALTIYGALSGNTDFNFIPYDKMSWRHAITSVQWEVLKRSAKESVAH